MIKIRKKLASNTQRFSAKQSNIQKSYTPKKPVSSIKSIKYQKSTTAAKVDLIGSIGVSKKKKKKKAGLINRTETSVGYFTSRNTSSTMSHRDDDFMD